jgi:hypothetical protein
MRLAPKFEKRNHRSAGLALTGPLMQGQPANVNESTIAISERSAPAGFAEGRGEGFEGGRSGT